MHSVTYTENSELPTVASTMLNKKPSPAKIYESPEEREIRFKNAMVDHM